MTIRKDIDFNFTAHPLTGDLSTKKDSSAIRQSLVNIALTNFYERGFFVEFGTNLRGSLFENVTPLELETLKQNIERAIKNFEPQVEIIQVLMDIREENKIYAVVVYNEGNDPTNRKVEVDLRRLR